MRAGAATPKLAFAPYLRPKGVAAGRLQARQGDYDWVELERWFSEAAMPSGSTLCPVG
jgi:hypothetical protein